MTEPPSRRLRARLASRRALTCSLAEGAETRNRRASSPVVVGASRAARIRALVRPSRADSACGWQLRVVAGTQSVACSTG